jgi:hypothetical protein
VAKFLPSLLLGAQLDKLVVESDKPPLLHPMSNMSLGIPLTTIDPDRFQILAQSPRIDYAGRENPLVSIHKRAKFLFSEAKSRAMFSPTPDFVVNPDRSMPFATDEIMITRNLENGDQLANKRILK